jgi:hypothetical protein
MERKNLHFWAMFGVVAFYAITEGLGGFFTGAFISISTHNPLSRWVVCYLMLVAKVLTIGMRRHPSPIWIVYALFLGIFLLCFELDWLPIPFLSGKIAKAAVVNSRGNLDTGSVAAGDNGKELTQEERHRRYCLENNLNPTTGEPWSGKPQDKTDSQD